jgi:hypothetical protein
MSKFFKPVDLPEPQMVKAVNPNPDTEEQLEITDILTKIENELSAIRGGTSKLHSVGIYMVDGKSTVLASFNRLKSNRTRANIRVFLAISQQDISLRVAEYFTSLFQSKYGKI